MKPCTACKEIKPFKAFSADARHFDGLQSQCLSCQRAYRQKWYTRNIDKIRAKDRARIRCANHKASKKAYDQIYRAHPRLVLTARQKLLKKYWPDLTHIQAEQKYRDLLAKQGDLCALCRRPEKSKAVSGAMKSLSVDHCHTTGRVRGLLCDRCNRGIGLLGDDPERLAKVIEYLQSGGCSG